jgi:glycosyltransferase involved in cell wall biosynthesis
MSPATGSGCRHPAVSVIVATTATRPALLAALQSIRRQQCDACELIVAVNGGRPELRRSDLEAAGARVVEIAAAGVCRARNAALPQARGQILVFADDDVEAAPGWLHALIAPFADPAVAVVTGGVTPEGGAYQHPSVYESEVTRSEWRLTREDAQWFARALRAETGSGCNMAFRRSFLETNPFPEKLGAGSPIGFGDEHFMFVQALRQGYALQHVPQARVVHREERPERIPARLRRAYATSLAFHLKLLLAMPGTRRLTLRELARRVRKSFRISQEATLVPPLSLAGKARAAIEGVWLTLRSL